LLKGAVVAVNQYSIDLRDIRFVLHNQLSSSEVLGQGDRFGELDQDLIDSVIDAAHEMAVEVLWPINASGDRQGCSYDGAGNVTTPDG
jgi:hypothetical protein